MANIEDIFNGPNFLRTPHNLIPIKLQELFLDVPETVKEHARLLLREQWTFFLVAQRRGRCYYGERKITIPQWAYKKGGEYRTYYIAHEMAHAYDKARSGHGMEFMVCFKRICPPELWHHELDYKPRNATAAGITNKE